MKRVKVAAGKFVWISDELAAKAAGIRMPTKGEFASLIALAPKHGSTAMLGPKLRRQRKLKRR